MLKIELFLGHARASRVLDGRRGEGGIIPEKRGLGQRNRRGGVEGLMQSNKALGKPRASIAQSFGARGCCLQGPSERTVLAESGAHLKSRRRGGAE